MEYVKCGICEVWNMGSVEYGECGKCRVWKIRNRKGNVWKMWSLGNENCRMCGVLNTKSVEYGEYGM